MLNRLRAYVRPWLNDVTFQRLFRNSSALFGAQTFVALISAIQFPLVLRALGPEHYGLWGLATGWVGLVGQIFGVRLWEAVVKFLTQFLAESDEARALAVIKLCVFADLIFNVAIFVGLNLTADLAAHVIYRAHPGGADLIRFESLNGLMAVTTGVWVAALRVFDKFKRLSLYTVVSTVAQFVLWMAVLWLKGGAGELILASAIVKLGQTITLVLLTQREISKRFQGRWHRADLRVLQGYRRAIAGVVFNMSVDTLRKIAVGSVDILILGWLSPPAQVGIYKLAKQLAGFVSSLTNPIYESLYPEMMRVYSEGGGVAVRPIAARVTRLMLLALVFSIGVALLASPWLVPLLFGPEFTPAIPVFAVMLFGNIWLIGVWAPSTLVAAGRARQLTVINTTVSLVMIVLLIVLIPLWGAAGAAAAQVVFYSLWLVAVLFASRDIFTQPAVVAGPQSNST